MAEIDINKVVKHLKNKHPTFSDEEIQKIIQCENFRDYTCKFDCIGINKCTIYKPPKEEEIINDKNKNK